MYLFPLPKSSFVFPDKPVKVYPKSPSLTFFQFSELELILIFCSDKESLRLSIRDLRCNSILFWVWIRSSMSERKVAILVCSFLSGKNNLIPLILDDNLDDIMGHFQEDQVTLDYIVQTQEKVAHKFNHLVVEYKNLRGLYFNKFEENRKEFAIKYKNHELFSYVMRGLNTDFREVEQVAESRVKEYILNKCRTLTEAKKFIDSLN